MHVKIACESCYAFVGGLCVVCIVRDLGLHGRCKPICESIKTFDGARERQKTKMTITIQQWEIHPDES